jgi:hypothetical protein
LNTLRALTESTPVYARVALPGGASARIQSWVVRFPTAAGRLGTRLAKTYRSKPLVNVGDGLVFGEIAIAQALQQDGWKAVWADSFHRKFWSAMPGVSDPVELPVKLTKLLTRIASLKRSKGGCFDVIAWKRRRTIFVEYKGPRDRPNKNESRWIKAALRAGVSARDLFFVEARGRRDGNY